MALSDKEIDELIALGATDDEIVAVEEERTASMPKESFGKKAGNFAKEALMRLTPAGSVAEIAGQLSGDRPESSLRAGLAGADIASLGLAGKVRAGVEGGKLGLRGVGSALAGGAGAGAASWGAQAAGAPWYLQLLAGLGGGMGAARAVGSPTVRAAVPVGDEAAAVSRASQRMGLNVAEPLSTRPRDVASVWRDARQGVGAQVGEAKKAALETASTAPEVKTAISEAVKKGLTDTGVPAVGGELSPSMATNPAGAQRVLEKLGIVSQIPETATGKDALTIANNVLEGLKGEIADSARLGTGVAGRNAAAGAGAWQEAIDALGPKDKVEVANKLNDVFSKLVTLQKVATKSATLQGGNISPVFSPRRFASLWETLPDSARKRFSAQEIEIIDSMIKQRPGIIDKVVMGIVNYAKAKGIKGISFTPQPRFYEPRPGRMPFAPGTSASAFRSALNSTQGE